MTSAGSLTRSAWKPRAPITFENDRHLSPWQEAVGHEIIPDAHKNGCANEATTGLTLGRRITSR